jgi:ABC-type polysaccharide transport system permease subunit
MMIKKKPGFAEHLPKKAIPGYKPPLKGIKKHWQLYFVVALPVIYLIIFKYVPLWGSQIAFRNYNFTRGVAGSPWVGFKHFRSFFNSPQFSRLLVNTIGLSVYSIFAGIWPPIILALSLNYARRKFIKKTVQLITYMPYFISTVLVVGILMQMLSLSGPINRIIADMGGNPVQFMGSPTWFKTVYVWSDIWKNTGYNAVVYLAALTAVSPELHEAAIVDGANIWQRIYHVDIPSIVPTAVVLLIMSSGRVMNMGAEKVLLMQNQLNMQSSDIISTYVYRIGLVSMQFSYSTAIGLFQSVVSLLLLMAVNLVSRKVNETSLW